MMVFGNDEMSTRRENLISGRKTNSGTHLLPGRGTIKKIGLFWDRCIGTVEIFIGLSHVRITLFKIIL